MHLVDAFVRICPSLLVKFSTLVEAFRNVNSTHPRSRAGNVLREARNWACNVKLVLSHWRNLAVYPERHARSMLEADVENKRTITRLTKSIEPYSVTTRFEETSPTTGGTSQPSTSSPTAGSTTSDVRSTMNYDPDDVVCGGELEPLDEGLPAAAGIKDAACPIEENDMRRTRTEELEARGVETAPKRRKHADDDAVKELFEAIAGLEQTARFEKATQTDEDMFGDITATLFNRGYFHKLVHEGFREPLKQTRHNTISRAYAAARKSAWRDKCSKEEVSKRCRDATRLAAAAWDEIKNRGNGV